MGFLMNGENSVSEILNAVRELNPAQNPIYSKLDDISFARLFSDVFRNVARYNETAKAWFVYNGIKWEKDPETMRVDELSKILARVLLVYASGIDNPPYLHYVVKLQDRRGRETMLKDARSTNCVKSSDFDTDPYLFNCINCVVDLHTLEPLPHDPEKLLSKCSNVFYKPDARSEVFESFINEIMKGNRSMIEYIQRLAGYSLTGENTHEECYLCYGSTTRNGKSTLLDTLLYLFGDYGTNTNPDTLALKDRDSRNASGDIARFDGVRFLHCGEPPKKMRFDVALLKKFLGRDSVTARNLYESEFTFYPVFKLFINSNYLPLVADDTLFSSGRIKILPFTRHFEPEEQDIHLKEKLKAPDEIAGLFNWCLEGLKMYQAEGEVLNPPEEVVLATEEYRDKSDKIKSFIRECMLPTEGAVISAKSAYDLFGSWCRDNGFGVENKSNFFEELRTKGLLFDRGTINGVNIHNVIKGYTLDDSFLPNRFPFPD